MLSEGFVLKTDGEFATVGVKRQTACDSCRAKCGGHCDKAETVETVVRNTLNAKVGDRVILYSDTATVMTFAAIVFVLPLIMAGVGFAVPYLLGGKAWLNAVISVLAFVATYGIIWLKYRNKKSYDTIKMKEISERQK